MSFYKTPLQKSISKYCFLLDEWKKRYTNDYSVEEFVFEKDDNRIMFQEDLREHIVNFSAKKDSNKSVKVFFRKIVNSNCFLINELQESLNELGIKGGKEEKEVEIYFKWLQENYFQVYD